MTTNELQQILLSRKEFTIPQIQQEFNLSYAQVRQCVQCLLQIGAVQIVGDLTYQIVDSSRLAKSAQPHDERLDKYQDMIENRRQELTQILKSMGKADDVDDPTDVRQLQLGDIKPADSNYGNGHAYNDEDDDDYDDEDEDEDEEDDYYEDDDEEEETYREVKRKYDALKRQATIDELKNLPSAQMLMDADTCRMIDGIDYGEYAQNAQKIINKLQVWQLKLQLRAITFGVDCTCYVFEYLSMRRWLPGFKQYELDIQACLCAEKVEIKAPYGYTDYVAVMAYNGQSRDPLSKQALLHWITKCNGKASIASIQRALGIGFNRAGKILENMQKMHCVQTLDDDATLGQPIKVLVTEDDVEILFPKSLGWL